MAPIDVMPLFERNTPDPLGVKTMLALATVPVKVWLFAPPIVRLPTSPAVNACPPVVTPSCT